MKIHRTIEGNEYAFELSPEELRKAYNEMEDTYMRLDIDNMLEGTETLTFRGQDDISTALFKGSERFYNDIIYRKEKQDNHLEDYQYAMNDVLSENGADYIKLIIEEQFADKDLFFLDPSGDIRWITYNPDSSAGGQFIDITFSQGMLRQAYASEEKIDEYILSRCSASLIDADTAGFIDYADSIAQKSPDWNDFNSVISNVIIQTKKEGNFMTISELYDKCKNSTELCGGPEDTKLVYLSDRDALQAIDQGMPVGFRSTHPGYHGSSAGLYNFTMVDTPEKFNAFKNSDVHENSAAYFYSLNDDEISYLNSKLGKDDGYGPAVSKADHLLYEQLIQERANQNSLKVLARYKSDNESIAIVKAPNGKYFNHYGYDENNGRFVSTAGNFDTFEEAEKTLYAHRPTAIRDFVENDIASLKDAGYWEKTNGICAIAEYKSGNRVPYFYENFENDPGLERAVHQLDNNKGVDSYTLYSDGKPVPSSEINAIREKNYPVSNSRSENFKWIPGMEISKQRYEEMYNVLPPLHLKNVCGFQSSEPYSHAENPRTGAFEPTFMTFVNIGDKYFYSGTNFAHEVNQVQYDNIINSIKAGQTQTKPPVAYKPKGRR